MGGEALKHTGTRRYENEEFQLLALEMIPKVREIFQTQAELVKSYRNKESHGDMDILVLKNDKFSFKEKMELIEKHFNPTDIVKNSDCWSFDYQELQIDLIFTPEENWETSQVFFAYNDLGNLMGKIFHKFGLKYGFDGVKYVLRSDDRDRVLKEFVLTKDMEKAFKFIGLSWEKFEEGFDDLQEIFDYVIGSPYFSSESFKLENLNAINKKRNRRRKVYQEFVEYTKDIEKNFVFKDKDTYLPIIDAYFTGGGLKEEIEKLQESARLLKSARKMFNGNLIRETYPSLEGVELGSAISGFTKYIKLHYNQTLDEFLITCFKEKENYPHENLPMEIFIRYYEEKD